MYGLSLAAGGLKGFAHLGALEALEQIGYSAEKISGTSVGSLIGALYADGMTVQEMYEEALNIKKRDVIGMPLFYKGGFFSTKKLRKTLEQYLSPNTTFDDLYKRDLMIVATDLNTEKEVIFKQGDNVIDAIIASCAVPIFFRPVNIKGHYFIDGCCVSNNPVNVLKTIEELQTIISLRLPYADRVNNVRLRPMKMTRRLFYIMMDNLSELQEEKADLAIVLPTHNHPEYSFKNGEELYQSSYEHVMNNKQAVKSLLNT